MLENCAEVLELPKSRDHFPHPCCLDVWACTSTAPTSVAMDFAAQINQSIMGNEKLKLVEAQQISKRKKNVPSTTQNCPESMTSCSTEFGYLKHWALHVLKQ